MGHSALLWLHHNPAEPADGLRAGGPQTWPGLDTHVVIGLRSLRLDGTGEMLHQTATLFYRFLEDQVPVEQQQATVR